MVDKMNFKISKVSPVVIPSDLAVSRRAPRPLAKRQDDYTDRFDYKTIFYDIYLSGNRVVFSGPPLLNLDSAMRLARFSLFGRERFDSPSFETLWKTQRTSIELNPQEIHGVDQRTFSIELGKLAVSGEIQPDENLVFENRKTVMTMSKNNNLKWIQDWATYYNRCHGVDSVLIYDNGSTDYSLQELLEAIESVSGIEAAVIVDWPFKYGPGGINASTWDSDFCQYSALEHARRRFVRTAAGLISVDIDELVVAEDKRSVFEHLQESKSGALLFQGRWIQNVTSVASTPPRFVDFRFYEKDGPPATKKWVIDPKRVPEKFQLNVHSFTKGFEPDVPTGVFHRHFVGVNSNWKKERTTLVPFDAERHVEDSVLLDALDLAFGSK